MKSFKLAAKMTLQIEEITWRLYKETNDLSSELILEMKNGSKVLRYRGDYGEYVGLPGDTLSTAFVKAVVVGYKADDLQWLLGLHVSDDETAKPTWIKLIAWKRAPNTRYVAEAQEAGRILADYIGCPLKLFGVKKLPKVSKTGPLEKHQRQDIEAHVVSVRASKMYKPSTYLDMRFEERNEQHIAIRIGKSAAAHLKDEPPYQNIDFDGKKEVVRMLPQTGLLGGIFSGARGQEIPFQRIRNIEIRHIIRQESKMNKNDDDNFLTEELITFYEWRMYITVPNEHILVAATQHQSSSNLSRQRAESDKTDRLDYSSNVSYYRRLKDDQAQKEKAKEWITQAAYHIAALIGCRLVETQLGSEI